MTSIGERLRQERIRQGVQIAQLVQDLRINAKYFEAIESGDPSQIPGGFFYRSFVRQYAMALGLDPTQFESELTLSRETEAPALSDALQKASFPARESEHFVALTNHRVASGHLAAYVALLICVAASCSAFYSWWREAKFSTPTMASLSAPFLTSDNLKPSTTPVQRVSHSTTSDLPTRIEETGGGGDAQFQTVANPAPSNPDDKVVLEVSAKETTWVAVRAEGKVIFSGLLEPSQHKILGSKTEQVSVKIGNAGGLTITWNGRSLGALGERGQVKTVVFTPEKFQIQPQAGGTTL